MSGARLTLTVVLPNHNHATLLPRALDALARQIRQADEILVINDASTDDSASVILSFRSRLPQLRLLENPERLGAVGSLNRGLREATGDLIYCGAADDATDPGLFAALVGALEAHPEAALACAEARVITDTGEFRGYRPISLPSPADRYFTPAETHRLLGRLDNWILSVVAVYRRAPLMAAGGLDQALGAYCDSFLARRLALQHGFVFVRQVLGTWYVQAESYSRATARDTGAVHRLIGLARQQIEASEGDGFPSGYGAVYDSRARFAAARLALEDGRRDGRLVQALSRLPWPGRLALRAVMVVPGRAGRLAALTVLTLWLRPISLVGLVTTALRRHAAGTADRTPK